MTTGAKLVILDPITSTMRGDLHKVEAVRAVLDPLTQLAQQHDIAIIGIMHFNKGTGNISDLLSGSHAFRDVARSVLVFAKDPEVPNTTIISVNKNNYGQTHGDSLAVSFESFEVDTDDGEIASAAAVVDIKPSSKSVEDIRYSDARSINPKDWLVSFLDSKGGEAPLSEIREAAEAAGLVFRTVANNRIGAGVSARRVQGFGAGSVWISPHKALAVEDGTNGTNGTNGTAKRRTVRAKVPLRQD